ncbi:MAG: sodium:solute symporter [Acidobacteria bacterium]|nr:MAG: sodium:solute symporter [Acidobacteriota bacterium]
MRPLDWVVLVAFLLFSVVFGIRRGRGTRDIRAYMLANKSMPWYAVALSIMATQASAITFVSTTGLAYADGMRFVQFYFGLPIAMVLLSIFAVPIFHRLNVYTAYEYLEQRFDLKTRVLTSVIFLVSRGLATSLSLYAPALILSVVLGWDVRLTIWLIGLLVILYTTLGGVVGVNWNDFQQFIVIMGSMFVALVMIIHLLPNDVSFGEALSVAGVMGRLNAVDFSFDWQNRYNFWSGLIGGLFLALAYFGTDQSQVQRYLTARSVAQSRIGLLFNGLAKVPMQFFILFVGAMVFVFYQFNPGPIFFNPIEEQRITTSSLAQEYERVQVEYREAQAAKGERIRNWLAVSRLDNPAAESRARTELQAADQKARQLRSEALGLMKQNDPAADTNDTNYVFLTFVIRYLPAGLVGLIIVVIFAATMSAISSALNSLATSSIVDVYKRLLREEASDKHYLLVSRLTTVGWGIFAILVSEQAARLGPLIEAVNILGSLFYGTVLGVFIVAFLLKRVRGTPTFVGALVGQAFVIWLFQYTTVAYLWLNVFGALAVVGAAVLLAFLTRGRKV